MISNNDKMKINGQLIRVSICKSTVGIQLEGTVRWCCVFLRSRTHKDQLGVLSKQKGANLSDLTPQYPICI